LTHDPGRDNRDTGSSRRAGAAILRIIILGRIAGFAAAKPGAAAVAAPGVKFMKSRSVRLPDENLMR
jgi:hypothetical protein